jgi:hypothetical protein
MRRISKSIETKDFFSNTMEDFSTGDNKGTLSPLFTHQFSARSFDSVDQERGDIYLHSHSRQASERVSMSILSPVDPDTSMEELLKSIPFFQSKALDSTVFFQELAKVRDYFIMFFSHNFLVSAFKALSTW